MFQHFDARCLSVAGSGPTKQYVLQIIYTEEWFVGSSKNHKNMFLFIFDTKY